MKRDPQPELDLGPAGMTLEELDARIAELVVDLASLRRIRRAKIAGIASGKALCSRRVSDERIQSVYDSEFKEWNSGAVRRTAEKLGVSRKSVWRARGRLKGH